MSESPKRGEIWFADLEPVKGHEQGRIRPVLIISVNRFNRSPAGLCTIVPLSSKFRDIPSHIGVDPSESGLDKRSFIICEQLRTISGIRLKKLKGAVSDITLRMVEKYLRYFLGL